MKEGTFLTSKEAAKKIGVTRAMVLRYILSNRLQAFKCGHQWCIPKQAVAEFKRPIRRKNN